MCMYIYVFKRNCYRQKVFWVLKFGKIGDRTNENKNLPLLNGFLFLVKKLHFYAFWYLFSDFLIYIGKIIKEKKTKEASTTKMV